ncbi:MAG: sulfatase-like hydrolase/transferase, partial [Planctomycetota bacterium]
MNTQIQTRRNFLKQTARAALGLGACSIFPNSLSAAISPQNSNNKPNILFIFADDQAFNTIRATGNEEVHTPNIDRLVNNGVTFTHAYNMGAWGGAVCVASRTMLNTG